MVNYLKKLRVAQLRNSNKQTQNHAKEERPLSPALAENLKALKELLNESSDVVVHKFKFGCKRQASGAIVFINGLIDKELVNSSIVKPLMYDTCLLSETDTANFSDLDWIQENMLVAVNHVKKISSLTEIADNIASAGTALLVDGSQDALLIMAKKWQQRSVEEPKTENVVRGPREAFTESVRINTTLIRRKIWNPNLCIESMKVGEQTRTEVLIVYLKGVANPKLVQEVKKRIKDIKIDAILESGYIEGFIEDAPYSIFSTVANVEKPDIAAAKILEGRVAIIVDGSPFVLTVPMMFFESFQSAEDYYSRLYFANIVRVLRFLAFTISVLAPAIYVALTTYHQELIPTELLITLAAGREAIPFPAVVEAFIMLVIFEILREAGVRLPRPIGSAVSIVGALVVGETAVSAGLIGSFMVIVVGLTAISSFLVPPQIDSGTILRFLFLILAAVAGGFGVLMGVLVTLLHLASLRSFGTPYLLPVAPLSPSGMKDSYIRVPIWDMLNRPRGMGKINSARQRPGQKPAPPEQ